jgi:ATP-binding cassette, subfamily B, bacterial
MERLHRILPYMLRQRGILTVIVALSLLMPVLAALAPLPMQFLVDRAIARGEPSLVLLSAGFAIVVFAAGCILEAGTTCAWTVAGQRMVMDVAGDLFAKLQRLSPVYHSRQRVGDLLGRLGGDSYCVYQVAEGLLVSPLQHLLTIVMVGLVAWRLDSRLALIALALAPAMALSVLWVGPLLKRRAAIQRVNDSSLLNFVHQTLGAISLVQANSAQQRNLEQYREMANHGVAIRQRTAVINNASVVISGTIATLGTAVVLFMGATRVQAGMMTVGTLLVFVAYLRSLQAAYQGLLSLRNRLKSAEAGLDRVLEVLDAHEEVVESPNAQSLRLERGARGISVDLDHVTFGYEPATPVLKDLTLHIEPGEVVALIGRTGAGKSTVASLIPRLLSPQQGSIRLAGQDVATCQLQSVRRAVAVVPQEALLLPTTISENIAWGRPDASPEQIRAAAEVAGAAEFIEGLPEGYQTLIGERGATLSGGQRQRLSLARAILKDAPVLILDEPTASLDARTEASVMSALERLMAGRTCIIVAHRLSTVRNAHRIVVLDQGRVVEQGTHSELMDRHGHYWEMQQSQIDRAGGAP